MSNYLSPGVYLKEIDASLYAKSLSSSVGAMMGITAKGPIEATLVTSWPQFEETYGGFQADSWLAYAVKDYFDLGGSALYIHRVVHYNDVSDETTISAKLATANLAAESEPTAVMATFTGKSYGSFFNGLVITTKVSDGFVQSDGVFDLTVARADGTILEKHVKLVSGAAHAREDRYLNTYIYKNSFFINAEDKGGALVIGSVALAGGDNGTTGITDADYIGNETSRLGLNAFDGIENINLVAIPGISSPAVIQALLSYVEKSQTLFAIVGTPRGLNKQQAIDFRLGTGTYSHTSFNTSYGDLYWPWIKFYNSRTNEIDYKPNEGAIMGVFAYNDAYGNLWDAPAGLTRGRIRNALGVESNTTKGDRDMLYDAGVNPIVDFKGDGVVVWGQKTLQLKPSATDRANVRRLLIYVEKNLSQTSRYLLFEPNNKKTWEAFKRFSNSMLQSVKDEGGVYDYLVICDETTNTPYYRDRNIMVAKVFIKPTKTAEMIELQVIVTDTGADFTLVNGGSAAQ